MEGVSIQTVLQMSNAAERVQQVAQNHGAVAAEQFKEITEKLNDLKREEVQTTEQTENARIRGEDQKKRQFRGGGEEARGEEREAAEKKEERVAVAPSLPVDAAPQGRLLNIRV